MNKKLRVLFAYHGSVSKYQNKMDDEIILASQWWDKLGVKTEIIKRDFSDNLIYQDYNGGAFKAISIDCQKEIAGKIEDPGEFHIIYLMFRPEIQGTAGVFTTYGWYKANGSIIICIPLPQSDAERTDQWLWRCLVHEGIHAFFGLLNLNVGLKLLDIQDPSYVAYRQQHLNPTEDELTNLSESIFNTWIKPHLNVLYNEPIEFQEASLKKIIIGLLTTLLGLLKLKKPTTKSVIQRLAGAMAQVEGFYITGSIAQRNNNPCCMVYSPYQAGKKDGFAYFNTDGEGWDATYYQLHLIFDGQSSYYQPTMSLMAFVNTWASTSPYNERLNYSKFIANRFGASIDTKLNQLT